MMDDYSYYQDRNLYDSDEEVTTPARLVPGDSALPSNLSLAGQFVDDWLWNATSTEDMGLYFAEKILTAVFLFLFIVVTIIGNILVIMSVFTYRPLRSVQNFFIVSLAAADLAVAILVMPFNIIYYVLERWIFGIVFCDMWLTFDVMCCTASILNLCAIALDRYYAIHDPINYAQKRTLKRVLVMIALVWGLSAVISIPPIIGWNNWDDRLADLQDNRTLVCKLTDERGYVIYSASGSFYIPLVIMSVVYLRIFLATRRRLRQRRMRTSALTSTAATANNYASPVNCETNDVEKDMHEISSTETPDDNADENHIKRNGADRHDKHAAPAEKTPRPSKISLDMKGHDKAAKPPPKPAMHQFLEERQKISLSKERRAARTLGIIMGVFILSWLPFFLMYIILPFCSSCVPPSPRMESLIVWLGYINSGLNPVIYTIFNIDFRRSFKRLLAGKRRGP